LVGGAGPPALVVKAFVQGARTVCLVPDGPRRFAWSGPGSWRTVR